MFSKYLQWILLGLVALVALIWWRYRQPAYQSGEMSPSFTTELKDGSQFNIDSLRGNYVLIHFWGSWCPPCRAENPHLVDLYHQFNKKGFEVFSVGIETNEQYWRRAIKQDGMVWPYHTSDFKQFDGELARLFNVHSIPTTFLVDPKGQVIALKPKPSEIGEILSKNL